MKINRYLLFFSLVFIFLVGCNNTDIAREQDNLNDAKPSMAAQPTIEGYDSGEIQDITGQTIDIDTDAEDLDIDGLDKIVSDLDDINW